MDQLNQTVSQLNAKILELMKTITTSDAGFPIRENLAAEAKLVIPVDTPILNFLPTKDGVGKAAAWKEITSFGAPNDPASAFFPEGGTPSGRTTVYADRSETYKLIGLDGGVTGFAVAAGANFQDQLAIEKRNTILHLKRLEEGALLRADGTGNTYSGLLTQITSGNGSYEAVSSGTAPSSVIDDLDTMLKDRWDVGGDIDKLIVRSAEAKLISDAVVSLSASPLRVVVDSNAGISGGFFVSRYISPITGHQSDIVPDRFHTSAVLIGLATRLPAPIPGQGGEGIYFDVLLDYAAADVPATADISSFRVKRYLTLAIPGRKFCAKITGF
jgi:hypothetical protein